MATLTHRPLESFGRAAALPTLRRSVLERAIAAAPSHVPTPQGWLRRLLARDQSAAALVRRYRLLPAIEHAYGRVIGEFGSARVEVSGEDSFGHAFVMVLFYCDSLDFERMSDVGTELGKECDGMIGGRNGHRLVLSVEPDPEAAGAR